MRYAPPARIFNSAVVFLLAGLSLFVGWIPASGAEPVRILALGDSLTAGYGLPSGQGFVDQLQARLRAEGLDVRVFNGGVSGDTSAGGRARLGWALADHPDVVIVELGANDGLRGLDPAALRSNLDAILRRLRAAGVRILLTGMRAPPNLGREYGTAFNRVYPDLAKKYHVAFYPFFLEGVAARPNLNQADGIHPNSRGVAVIVDRIAPYVVRLLNDR